MKFIHTGDIHWGMCPDANKPWGKERALAIKDTFRTIIENAKEMDVDCLFISGDLFHRPAADERFKGGQLSFFHSTFR